jgi:4-amino-4-deoxy-L-arabinose transferase-like glycosyltransferase
MSSEPASPSSRRFSLDFRALALPLGIALFALLLRLWGIGWALPNSGRYFSYHPDESVVTMYSMQVHPLLFLLDPGFYNYGSLSLLLNGLFIDLGSWTGLVGPGPAPNIPSAGALLTARLVTAVLGAATCLFLYGTGRLLYSRIAGIVAAALYAITPLPVQHGHFATVDVPATFWIAGALYFAARHLSETERRPRDLFWCGLWSGLAAATKYNAGLVLFAGIAAWWLGKPRTDIKPMAGAMGGAALGFVVGCPGIFLNPTKLLADLQFEANHAREGHGNVFIDTPSGFIYHITHNLAWGMGWPLVLAMLAGIGYAVYRRRSGDLILFAFALPYYILIGLAALKFARYTLPLFPPLVLLIGALVPMLPEKKAAARGVLAALGVAGVFAIVLTAGFNTVMTRPDTRDAAAAYIREKGVTSVGFEAGPWFFSPPLGPLTTHPAPPVAQKSALSITAPRLIPAAKVTEGVNAAGEPTPNLEPVEWNAELLSQTAPDAVAVSEFNYADAQRIALPAAKTYLYALKSGYPKQEVFASPVQVLGIPITKLNTAQGLPTQGLPHDMLYTNPTTVVFTK